MCLTYLRNQWWCWSVKKTVNKCMMQWKRMEMLIPLQKQIIATQRHQKQLYLDKRLAIKTVVTGKNTLICVLKINCNFLPFVFLFMPKMLLICYFQQKWTTNLLFSNIFHDFCCIRFDLNDARILCIDEQDIKKQFAGKESAYMLFYRRKSLQPTKIDKSKL